MPKVSVVMPFFNGANYIRESVDSVFAQDLTDWELVMVDDGSTDGSSGIAARLADEDERVIVVYHPDRQNHGLAESRVVGSNHASGDYLIFLDHDDLLAPDALSSMANVLDRNPRAAAVFAATIYWAFDRTVAEKDAVQSYYPLWPGMIRGGKMLRDLIRSDHHHPANCSTLFRRQALMSVRDTTEPYDGMYEDTALLLKLLCRHDVYLLQKPVSSYRLHRQSMSHQAQAEGTFTPVGYNVDRQRFLRWVSRSSIPLGWRSRLRLRWTLVQYRIESALSKLNASKTRTLIVRALARI